MICGSEILRKFDIKSL